MATADQRDEWQRLRAAAPKPRRGVRPTDDEVQQMRRHKDLERQFLGSLAPDAVSDLTGRAPQVQQQQQQAPAAAAAESDWETESADDSSYESEGGEPMKMVLVVRKDLGMGTGKIVAQCCHAAVDVVEEVQQRRQHVAVQRAAVWRQWLREWRCQGQTKVALRVDSEEGLLAVRRAARAGSLPCSVIRDAGRTQIAAGSLTVAAVGPAPAAAVDCVTGRLKLL
eukprot:TRINITY_DN5078_c0_g1_i1.p1 TRINITY_DN5078_c0_g1~~TRINITY_DN5078_c0_g1_i1.p1  ORF type:complete len:241 (+),score=51.73 TRINITY_DN5078_c0_g1_i1:53-724(+)